ncbi:unnamed protein product [Pedinophyceae sp. YPF-701]|nr:unnamed protein product [Pedinophyceae sp. YPF-701]
MAEGLGEPLPSGPQDGISALKFDDASYRLVVASWDRTVRVYDASTRTELAKFQHDSPALSCCFAGAPHKVASGHVDGSVCLHDVETGQTTHVGSHQAQEGAQGPPGVRGIVFLRSRDMLVTGGWNGKLKVWDLARGFPQDGTDVALPGKCFSMATDPRGSKIVVATSGLHVWVFDAGAIERGAPEQQRASCMKMQTRCAAAFPDAQGFAMGSVEGKVSFEYFVEGEGRKRFVFKCHREKHPDGTTTVHPVNAIAFHPQFGTFATGGCDGAVNIWDGINQKRIFALPKFPTSIAALDFSHDGSLLAVAASYTYERGPREHPQDTIYIRHVAATEAQPKPRA